MAEARAQYYRYRTCRGLLARYLGGEQRMSQWFIAQVAAHVIGYGA